jgi:NAD dependent epimerase/dehydratase family enzyme
MTEILGRVLHRPTFMPSIPGFLITMLMGEFGSLLLKGQKVLPKRLRETGFEFQFSSIGEALEDLLVRN